MKLRVRILLAALCALVGSAAFASPGATVPPFGPGEQLTLALKYLGVKAGSAQITVGAPTASNSQVWPIVGDLHTDTLLSWYPVKDKMVSFWDASTSRCTGSELYADENHNRHRQKVELDDASRTAVVLRQKEGEEMHRSVATIEPGAMDLFSATFALREKPLAVGDHYLFPIFTGAKNVQLEAVVEGTQPLDTPFGKENAIRVRVRTGLSGKFENKRDMYIFFSPDPRHVPVRLEAEFAFGAMTAEATDYKPGKTVVLPAIAQGGR